MQCPKTVDAGRSGQLKADDLNRVLFPVQMSETESGQVFPPSVYKRVTGAIANKGPPSGQVTQEKFPVLRDGVTKTSRDVVLFYEIFARYWHKHKFKFGNLFP